MDPVIVEIRPPRLIAEAEAAATDAAEGEDRETAVEKYIEKHTVRLGFISATRRQAYRRGDAMQAAQAWLLSALGVSGLAEVSFADMDRDIMATWLAAWQAADIIGALVTYENWTPPSEPSGWADVPDYIFNPALSMAWELNPQWAAEGAEAGRGN